MDKNKGTDTPRVNQIESTLRMLIKRSSSKHIVNYTYRM